MLMTTALRCPAPILRPNRSQLLHRPLRRLPRHRRPPPIDHRPRRRRPHRAPQILQHRRLGEAGRRHSVGNPKLRLLLEQNKIRLGKQGNHVYYLDCERGVSSNREKIKPPLLIHNMHCHKSRPLLASHILSGLSSLHPRSPKQLSAIQPVGKSLNPNLTPYRYCPPPSRLFTHTLGRGG